MHMSLLVHSMRQLGVRAQTQMTPLIVQVKVGVVSPF